MQKRQRILIFFLTAVMVFSVLGTGLVLMFQSGGQSVSDEELQAQLDSAQEQQQADANQCVPPSDLETNPDLKTPKVVTADGPVEELRTEEIQAGSGPAAELGDCVAVHYHGSLAQDGDVFDSSYERGQPAYFVLQEGGLIEGFLQGVIGMQEGGKRRVFIPYDLAYGENSPSADIPANSDLTFVIELVEIVE